MRNQLRSISTAVASALLALILIGALAVLLTSAGKASAATTGSDMQSTANTVLARRAISIPFGISSVLTLTQDGSQILATGHGVCWEEGQMFDLHVRIAQSTTNAFAEGHSIDICAGGSRQMWDADASVESRPAFEKGSARACAEATEFAQHGIDDEYRWCKDIELTQAE